MNIKKRNYPNIFQLSLPDQKKDEYPESYFTKLSEKFDPFLIDQLEMTLVQRTSLTKVPVLGSFK